MGDAYIGRNQLWRVGYSIARHATIGDPARAVAFMTSPLSCGLNFGLELFNTHVFAI